MKKSYKILPIQACSNCPHQYWSDQSKERCCKLSKKVIWSYGTGTPVTEFPKWCKLEDDDLDYLEDMKHHFNLYKNGNPIHLQEVGQMIDEWIDEVKKTRETLF